MKHAMQVRGARSKTSLFAAILAAALAAPAHGAVKPQADPPGVRPAPRPESTDVHAAAPAHAQAQPVARQADAALKAMGKLIGSANAYSFSADVTFDHVLPSGQKVQFAAAQDVVMERPGRLRVAWNGDLGARQFWYDGKTITLFDPALPFYASATAPGDLDQMLDLVVDKYGFSPPLADFLYSDAYKSLRQNVQYGFDLGESRINGRTCRSFAFVEKKIDWQIWIASGPEPVPCKVVITYKTHPAQPQFTAVFSDWKFSPRISRNTFTPELPARLERIGFRDVSKTKLALGEPQ
jgi:hypothetical protein